MAKYADSVRPFHSQMARLHSTREHIANIHRRSQFSFLSSVASCPNVSGSARVGLISLHLLSCRAAFETRANKISWD